MNMKKLSVAVVVMLGLGVSAANAADGTLNFAGSVASGTCSVNADSRALSVNFDAVSLATIKNLGSSGKTSPELQKPISINLSGCPESISTAKINFEGQISSYNANVFTSSGSGTASYVGATIKDEAGNPITPNTFDGEFNSKAIVAGNNTLTYLVGISRTNIDINPSTGAINIPVTYTLSYQ
jgi:major type 1 subunit fimbrin (pilin)